MWLPEKLSLTFFHNFECIEINDWVILFIFEADELRNVWIRVYCVQLETDGYFELFGYGLLFLQLEESDVISIKQLNDILVGDYLVDALGKLSLFDTGKDTLDFDLLVDVIVLKQIYFIVWDVAKYIRIY